MRIQVKAARRGDGIVILYHGEMYPCTDADDAWDTLAELYQERRKSTAAAARIPGAATLSLREKNGLLIVADQRAEIFTCEDEVDLWKVIQDAVKGLPTATEPPKTRRTFPAREQPTRTARRTSTALAPTDPISRDDNEVQVISDDVAQREISQRRERSRKGEQSIQDDHDEEEQGAGLLHQIIADQVGDSAATLATTLAKKLVPAARKMSHRGPAPKPGSRRPKKRVKKGDIY